MQFALCTEGGRPTWLQAVVHELERRRHVVDVVSGMTWVLSRKEMPDGAWVRWVPGSYGIDPPAYWQAAMSLEACGTRMLNSMVASSVASDKLLSAAAFQRTDLRHPLTWELGQADWAEPRIVKPILGSRGVGVALCRDLRQAKEHQQELGRRCLAQQRINVRRCLRVVASPLRVIKTYEKYVEPGTLIASVSQGADRRAVTASAEIARYATGAVAALGGGLMGIDLLEEDDGALWLLEANGSFAFDEHDREIVAGYADELELVARS
jgi:glutathione synthase/RimK-type ligase-like ATP-grasp enzyme